MNETAHTFATLLGRSISGLQEKGSKGFSYFKSLCRQHIVSRAWIKGTNYVNVKLLLLQQVTKLK
jgi:hypothetical protein